MKIDLFERCKEAKLRPADISKLMKVSRVTASLWFNGHAQPHRLLAGRLQKILNAIDAALAAGTLPVPYEVSRRERGLYIKEAIVKHLPRGANSPL